MKHLILPPPPTHTPTLTHTHTHTQSLTGHNHCPITDTGALLFDALIDNFCLRKINLRGNTFDDDVAEALGDLLHANNILEDLDLGDNRMGHLCCRSLALGTTTRDRLQTSTFVYTYNISPSHTSHLSSPLSNHHHTYHLSHLLTHPLTHQLSYPLVHPPTLTPTHYPLTIDLLAARFGSQPRLTRPSYRQQQLGQRRRRETRGAVLPTHDDELLPTPSHDARQQAWPAVGGGAGRDDLPQQHPHRNLSQGQSV